ncbi:MAG TPA: MerR family transcriptional regulator [Ktedonobacterales bacterium]|nr:MerR family transcriptional regulator [Ktedonobacterales bacterium]
MLANQEHLLTIQQAAKLTGLTAHTLRYYERIALLTPIGRAPNGHRRYDHQDVERITFLNYLRLTGMPLEQMKAYTALLDQGDASIPRRVALLQSHRDKVARRVEELRQMLAVIDYKLAILAEQIG